MSKPTIDDLIKAIKRELMFRQKVYPKMVNKGQMSTRQMLHELDCMEAVLDILTAIKYGNDEVINEFKPNNLFGGHYGFSEN